MVKVVKVWGNDALIQFPVTIKNVVSDTETPVDMTSVTNLSLLIGFAGQKQYEATGESAAANGIEYSIQGDDHNVVQILLKGDNKNWRKAGSIAIEASFTLDGKAYRFTDPYIFTFVSSTEEARKALAQNQQLVDGEILEAGEKVVIGGYSFTNVESIGGMLNFEYTQEQFDALSEEEKARLDAKDVIYFFREE